jgi:hypothetical protein
MAAVSVALIWRRAWRRVGLMVKRCSALEVKFSDDNDIGRTYRRARLLAFVVHNPIQVFSLYVASVVGEGFAG